MKHLQYDILQGRLRMGELADLSTAYAALKAFEEMDDCTEISILYGSSSNELMWNDPADTSAWVKTELWGMPGGCPVRPSQTGATLLATDTGNSRNNYSLLPFTHSAGSDAATWGYTLFAYAQVKGYELWKTYPVPRETTLNWRFIHELSQAGTLLDYLGIGDLVSVYHDDYVNDYVRLVAYDVNTPADSNQYSHAATFMFENVPIARGNRSRLYNGERYPYYPFSYEEGHRLSFNDLPETGGVVDNRWQFSTIRQYLNSSASGHWYVRQTDQTIPGYDMPQDSRYIWAKETTVVDGVIQAVAAPGFLHGLDPLLRSCLVPVSRPMLWPYILDTAIQQEGLDTKEAREAVMVPHSVTDTVFLPTRSNIFNLQSSDIYSKEGSDFQYYRSSTAAKRKKTTPGASGTASGYFLSSCYNVSLDNETTLYSINTSGQYNNREINYTSYSITPCFCV